MDFSQILIKLYSSIKSTLELSSKSLVLMNNLLEGRVKLNLELKIWMRILMK